MGMLNCVCFLIKNNYVESSQWFNIMLHNYNTTWQFSCGVNCFTPNDNPAPSDFGIGIIVGIGNLVFPYVIVDDVFIPDF